MRSKGILLAGVIAALGAATGAITPQAAIPFAH